MTERRPQPAESEEQTYKGDGYDHYYGERLPERIEQHTGGDVYYAYYDKQHQSRCFGAFATVEKHPVPYGIAQRKKLAEILNLALHHIVSPSHVALIVALHQKDILPVFPLDAHRSDMHLKSAYL